MNEELNAVTDRIIGAAIAVHRELGPGILESAYEACMVFELLERGLSVERQKPLPLVYRGQRLDCGFRIDLLVQGESSYLRLSGSTVGLLIISLRALR